MNNETPLNNKYRLKNEGQKYKTGLVREWVLARGDG
jgi:hypothetical protein